VTWDRGKVREPEVYWDNALPVIAFLQVLQELVWLGKIARSRTTAPPTISNLVDGGGFGLPSAWELRFIFSSSEALFCFVNNAMKKIMKPCGWGWVTGIVPCLLWGSLWMVAALVDPVFGENNTSSRVVHMLDDPRETPCHRE
jgi:hypothetical protein